MILWLLIISSPVLWSFGSKYEGDFFPVVSKIKILSSAKEKQGVFINVSFKKFRQCEFIGISWYSKFNVRLPIIYENDAELSPLSRPTGPQSAGPWLIRDLKSLDGSRAIVSHKCHPLWITHTVFYP